MQTPPKKYDVPFRRTAVTDLVYNASGPGAELVPRMNDLAKVDVAESPYRIFWGELHCHSSLSDGVGDPDTIFRVARETARLDFFALTDHDHGGVGRQKLAGTKWDTVKACVARHHAPGEFVTFLGYERDSYPWYNNLVLYYRDPAGDLVTGNQEGEISERELRDLLGRDDIITVPHTTGFISSGTDFDCIPPDLMTPLIEVYSKWGTSEYFGNANPVRVESRGGAWQDALEHGARMGCIAGSDEHGGLPGLPAKTVIRSNLRYANPGLTAVLATELTREAVFDAIRNRRCYAASGARIAVDFRVNGAVIGSELDLPRDRRRELHMSVRGEDLLRTVTLVKNGRDSVVWHVDAESAVFQEFLYDYRVERDTDYYYLRIEQMDGRMAWTSPVWVTAR